MPLYAYQCKGCGSDFDARRPIAERDGVDCPSCGGPALRHLATINTVGVKTAEPAFGCGAGACAADEGAVPTSACCMN